MKPIGLYLCMACHTWFTDWNLRYTKQHGCPCGNKMMFGAEPSIWFMLRRMILPKVLIHWLLINWKEK